MYYDNYNAFVNGCTGRFKRNTSVKSLLRGYVVKMVARDFNVTKGKFSVRVKHISNSIPRSNRLEAFSRRQSAT